MTKRAFAEELRAIARGYGIKVYFYKNYRDGGWCNLAEHSIAVGMKDTNMQQMASIFFHEMAHLMNKINRKFRLYHSAREWSRKKPTRGFLATAWRAEKYTEKQGRIIAREHMPYLKFKTFYGDQFSRRWLNKYISEAFGLKVKSGKTKL